MIACVSRTAGLIARPALAAVLVALTDLGDAQEAVLSGRVTAWRLEDRGVHFRWDGVPYFALYSTRDPDEAWEILDARGLLPPEGARGFWCHDCRDGYSCETCMDSRRSSRGWTVRPATIPDVVAWDSLGADAIVTAEALAVEACRDLRVWGAVPCERVVWREGVRDDGGLVTSAPSIRALWDMGLALERVGAECVLCVPPVPSAALGSIDTNPLYDAPPRGS